MGKMVRGFPCKGENRLAQRKQVVSSRIIALQSLTQKRPALHRVERCTVTKLTVERCGHRSTVGFIGGRGSANGSPPVLLRRIRHCGFAPIPVDRGAPSTGPESTLLRHHPAD